MNGSHILVQTVRVEKTDKACSFRWWIGPTKEALTIGGFYVNTACPVFIMGALVDGFEHVLPHPAIIQVTGALYLPRPYVLDPGRELSLLIETTPGKLLSVSLLVPKEKPP